MSVPTESEDQRRAGATSEDNPAVSAHSASSSGPATAPESAFSHYRAGQNLVCKVVESEHGGYSVRILKDDLPGFLPTQAQLKVGQEILVQFVRVRGERAILSKGFETGRFEKLSITRPVEGRPAPAVSGKVISGGRWRRATDIVLPPIDDQKARDFKIGEVNLDDLIKELESTGFTGCVKGFSEVYKSRSAALLYRGRVVGCIYGNESLQIRQTTEFSLQMMLHDLQDRSATVIIYTLPEEVTLSMSALFLGYPVERSDDLDARQYLDYICDWLQVKQETGCLSMDLPSTHAIVLVYIHEGKYLGAFFVEHQQFSNDISFVYNLLRSEPGTQCAASFLPAEMTTKTAEPLGFSLSAGKRAAEKSAQRETEAAAAQANLAATFGADLESRARGQTDPDTNETSSD